MKNDGEHDDAAAPAKQWIQVPPVNLKVSAERRLNLWDLLLVRY
jgi:hypothetical protein